MSFITDRDESDSAAGRSELVENLEALRRIPIFRDIPLEMIKLYAYTARRQAYRSDELVFRQGSPAREAFLILSGTVRLWMADPEGHQVDLQVLDPGGFFGYMALLAEYEWPLSAQAASPAELLIVDRRSFRKILVRYPEKGFQIVERLVQMRMARMKSHMSLLMRHIDGASSLDELYRIDALSR